MEAWSRMLMGKSRRWGRVEEMMSALVVTVHKVTQGCASSPPSFIIPVYL